MPRLVSFHMASWEIVLSIISLFGWFFCLGHLFISHWRPSWNRFAYIFSVSLALLTIGLGVITPWIALPSPILLLAGLAIAAWWFYHMPPLPPILIEKMPSPFFVLSMFLLTIYFFVLVLLPNHGFDNLSYHIPFIHEFSSFGQISLPVEPMNWVDHAHYIYTKSIEMVLGLSHQILTGSYPWIHFLFLAGFVFLLPDLALKAGAKRPWLASVIFLSSGFVLGTVKHYFIETAILLLYTSVLLLIMERKDAAGRIPLLFIFGMAIALSKNTGVIFLIGVALASYYFYRSHREGIALVGGGLLGIIVSFLPAAFVVSLLKEFQIVQVTSVGQYTPYEMRILLIWEGIKRFILRDIWAVPFLLSPFVFLISPKSRPALGMIFASFICLCLSFVVTNFFALTYLQIGAYYSFAFIGGLSIAFPIFLEKIEEKMVYPISRVAVPLLLITLLVGIGSVLTFTQLYSSGGVINGTFYNDLHDSIPNSPSTKIFSMNNVNPLTLGFEKAIITDYTKYPRPSGDPCTFWKENEITHIVYWRHTSSSYQLDGGNPEFYRDSQEELLQGTCTRLLMQPPTPINPLIGEVLYEKD